MPGLVAGVDSSTQATKVLVVEPESGAVVASGRAPHPVDGEGGARETHPDAWWDGARRARCARPAARRDVAAIAIAGQQHGLVVLDARRPRAAPRHAVERHPQRRGRGRAGRRARRRALGRGHRRRARGVLHRLQVGLAAARGARHAPPPPARVHLPHDHLTWRLTGEAATDRGDASGTGWWSSAPGGLQRRGARAARRRPRPGAAAVRDGAAGARRARCPPARPRRSGCRPASRSPPAPATTWPPRSGSASRRARRCSRLGTSGTAFAVSERRPVDPSGIVAGFADASGRYLPLACTLNATLAVDRMAALARARARRRGARRRGRGAALARRRAHAEPAARRRLASTACGTPPRRGQILRRDVRRRHRRAARRHRGDRRVLVRRAPTTRPLLLVGGGAQGAAWRDAVLRLSGRRGAGARRPRSSWRSAPRPRPPAC